MKSKYKNAVPITAHLADDMMLMPSEISLHMAEENENNFR